MQIIPAIDLKDGQCVRLKQGRMEDDTVFSTDVVATATRWVEAGASRLHIVAKHTQLLKYKWVVVSATSM